MLAEHHALQLALGPWRAGDWDITATVWYDSPTTLATPISTDIHQNHLGALYIRNSPSVVAAQEISVHFRTLEEMEQEQSLRAPQYPAR